MQRNYMTITYAYHLICELMIAFFLSIPIFYYYYETVPYTSFSLVVLGAVVIYVQLFLKVRSYVPYILLAPVLMALFYFLSYALFMSILFGAVFTWRAIILRKEHRLDSEGTYLRFFLILSVTLPLFIHELMFIVFVVTVLFLLIIGNIVRNMTVLPKQDRRSKSTAFLVGTLGLVIAGITIITFSFNGVRALIGLIWSGITTVLTWVGSFLVYLLSLIPIPDAQEQEQQEQSDGEFQESLVDSTRSDSMIDHLFTWLFIIGCIIAAFFIIRFIRKLLKKTFKPMDLAEDHITYEQLDEVNERKRSWRDRFKKLIPYPKDHVRKRMFQFERKMSTTAHARKREETIEEWVERTGWEIDFELYQRVRYGTYEATKHEIEQLEEMIDHIEEYEKKRLEE